MNLMENAPRKPKGYDHRDDPRDMENTFLVSLAMELNTLTYDFACSEEVKARAREVKVEIIRRLELVNVF